MSKSNFSNFLLQNTDRPELNNISAEVISETENRSKPWGKHLLTASLLSATYLLLSFLLLGFKTDQVFLALLFSIPYLASKKSRSFITGFSIFFIHWILFDYMKALPNYLVNSVNIESLYNLEKSFFGITQADNGIILTPNEFFLKNNNAFLDVISGFFYLSWVPVPMMFAGFMFFKNRKQFFLFSLTFLFVNLLGYIVYYCYPASPPWYVQNYGFNFYPGTPGNTAGLARFDSFFGIELFSSMYAKSSNVFAAMPSLHSAYPVIVFYYGLKNKLGLINLFFAIVMVGIWFAAVYTSHHYILDVLAGVICAITAIYLFRWMAEKNKFVKNLISGFIKATK